MSPLREARTTSAKVQKELAARLAPITTEAAERIDGFGQRMRRANDAIGSTVNARLSPVAGIDRLPQPTEVINAWFDAVDKVTKANRTLALNLAQPWDRSTPNTDTDTESSADPATTRDSAAPTAADAKTTTAAKATTAAPRRAAKASAARRPAARSTKRTAKRTANAAPSARTTATDQE